MKFCVDCQLLRYILTNIKVVVVVCSLLSKAAEFVDL